ncbi:MAG: hypothetical protein WCP35_16570, partial [Verrucomicrobiota bacterium]
MNEIPEKEMPNEESPAPSSAPVRMSLVSRLLLARNEHVGWLNLDIVAVVVIIALFFSAKPAYLAFRESRLKLNLQAARTAVRNEDWSSARDMAHSVLLVHGENFEAYRIWTRALGKLGTPSAYMAAAEVFTDTRASREDLLEELDLMVHQAPQAVALSADASLPAIFRDQAIFCATIVPLLIQRGQIDLAENSLRESMQPHDGPKVKLEWLRVLCNRPTPERVAEAQRVFADLLATHADEQALAALLILGDTPGALVEGGALPDLPEWLDHQPKATTLHHLLGMHPALRARPEEAPRLYAMAAKRFLASDPGVLGTWLLRHKHAQMAVTLLAEAAKTRSDAYLARLNALVHLNKDAEVAVALAAPPASVDLVELEIVQANIAASRGDMIASGAAWTRALNHAAFDTTRNRCLDLASLAQRRGAKDAAEDAWVAAVRLGWGQLPTYADLLPVFTSLMAKGRTEDLMAMFRTLLRFEPNNPELLNNAYYFALLQDVLQPGQVATVISKLTGREDKPVFNSTLMLAEMLDGHPSEALALLPKVRAGNEVAPMMVAAPALFSTSTGWFHFWASRSAIG